MQFKVKLLVVLATYNERENLPTLVQQLLDTEFPIDILVVDDDSPDGTGEWAQEQADENEALNVVVRKNERGIGSASIAGIKWGLQRDYQLIGTMDADHSHSPAAMHEMYSAMADDKIDLLLGSRYIAGGNIAGWSWHRRIISRVLNWFVRIWLWLPTRDNSGACRIYRANAFDDVEIDKIKSDGYAYLEEIVFLFRRANKNIAEHPITFHERAHGSSKLSIRQSFKALFDLFTLRFSR